MDSHQSPFQGSLQIELQRKTTVPHVLPIAFEYFLLIQFCRFCPQTYLLKKYTNLNNNILGKSHQVTPNYVTEEIFLKSLRIPLKVNKTSHQLPIHGISWPYDYSQGQQLSVCLCNQINVDFYYSRGRELDFSTIAVSSLELLGPLSEYS